MHHLSHRSHRRPGDATTAAVAVTATATLLAGLLVAAPSWAPTPSGPSQAAPAAPAAQPRSAPARPAPVAAVRPARAAVAPASLPQLPALPPDVLARQLAAGLTCETTASGLPLCHHGDDHAPPEAAPVDPFELAGGEPPLPCYGDGTSGPRVRAVYARPQGSQDRFSVMLPSFRRWAAVVDKQVDDSAVRTKGRRHVRWATTSGSGCALTVLRVTLPPSAFSSFRATVDALQAAGLRQPQSKYLVWADATGYCGISTSYADDSPGQANANNGGYPSFARVDRGCWGKVETHELVHMLGGVQPTARNATKGFHCSDGHDVMCYDDGTAGSAQRAVCPSTSATVLDCRNDDYFSTSPVRGSYLDTHWNVARSAFLSAAASEPAPRPSPSPTATPRPSTSPSPSTKPSPKPTPSPSTTPLLPALPLPELPDLPDLPVPGLGTLLGAGAP